MSGIAEILNNLGIKVTGSDMNQSENTQKLIEHGFNVTIGHDLENVSKCDLVVYTAAISKNDVELLKAKEYNIPTLERSTFLGYLTKCFKNTIGISGTHGKTTTTSMVSICFIKANLDPTIQVGAMLKQLDGNYRIGNSDYFIIEACEYVESFLQFSPKTEVVLNIDNDHLDYFKNFNNIKNAFIKYVKLLPDDGILVLNADDSNCLDLSEYTNAKIVTYGINNNADFIAKNIQFNCNGFASFDVYYNNSFYNNFCLSVPGSHNILNALACISLCNFYNIDKDIIKQGLLEFTGAHRRFEHVGEFNNFSIYDDYCHHPTEISATAKILQNKKYNESWCIFQPHTYSRTKKLLDDFAKCLLDFDHIIITDIYAAREINKYNIKSQDLVDKINKYGKDAILISDFNDICNFIKQNAKANDIVLTLGAGSISDIAYMFCK